jgi:hypothetical protein
MAIASTIERLDYLLNIIPEKLEAIPANEMEYKPAPEKWSKKEILGHLLDSAANNQQRFVRIQFEDCPRIKYDQNKWIEYSYYRNIPTGHMIELWKVHNRQLRYIMSNTPPELLGRTSTANTDEILTLGFLIDDYVEHMEHHLRQILPAGY